MTETARILQNLVNMQDEEIKRLKAANEQLRRQNQELVTEIKIRGDVISALQSN